MALRGDPGDAVVVSTPVLNICQLVVSLTFGLVVFRERLFTAPLVVVAEVSGLAIMVLGVTRLASRAAATPGIEPEKASGDDTEVGAPRTTMPTRR